MSGISADSDDSISIAPSRSSERRRNRQSSSIGRARRVFGLTNNQTARSRSNNARSNSRRGRGNGGRPTSVFTEPSSTISSTNNTTFPEPPATFTITRPSHSVGAKAKSKVTFAVTNNVSSDEEDLSNNNNAIFSDEKILSKILRYFNWNEILPLREVCKTWLTVISSDPHLKENNSGIITIRNLNAMQVFNDSLIIWTKFRIYVNNLFELSEGVQKEFWLKHGPMMTYLEIKNKCMTLSALVEILSFCRNLEQFSVTWTAEMYSFNSELIRKYFGLHFRNGNFHKMKQLTIEKSSFLVDNALWSLLKWCGGTLESLTLTCPSTNELPVNDKLSRLKPRWSIEPIQNYLCRFGYNGNLKKLDFTSSNLSPTDLHKLADIVQLKLTSLRLDYCKINNESLSYFIDKKGDTLEELYVDEVSITEDSLLHPRKLLHLKKLSICGQAGQFSNLQFLITLPSLQELHCANTKWLSYKMIQLKAISGLKKLSVMNMGMSENLTMKNVDPHTNWFLNFANTLRNITELNVSYWGDFGNDENFQTICQNMRALTKFRVRGWRNLSDFGITGLTMEEITSKLPLRDITSERMRINKKIGQSNKNHIDSIRDLSELQLLDIGHCPKITDGSINYAFMRLPNLRKISIDNTQVSDIGLLYLINGATTLDKISFNYCDKITKSGHAIRRQNRRVVFIGKI